MIISSRTIIITRSRDNNDNNNNDNNNINSNNNYYQVANKGRRVYGDRLECTRHDA